MWGGGQGTGESLVYDLFAVSNHTGSLEGGHYTACALSPSGVWHSYNDRHVSVVAGSAEAQTPDAIRAALHTKGAYVLMYQRRGSQGAPAPPKLPVRPTASLGARAPAGDGGSVGGNTAVTDASSVTYAGTRDGSGGTAAHAAGGVDDAGGDSGGEGDNNSEGSGGGSEGDESASDSGASQASDGEVGADVGAVEARRRSVTTPPAGGDSPGGGIVNAEGLRRRV